MQNRLEDTASSAIDKNNGDLEHYQIDKENSLVIQNPTQHDTGFLHKKYVL